jgi:hypothetical protein
VGGLDDKLYVYRVAALLFLPSVRVVPRPSTLCFENALAFIKEEAEGQYLRVVWKRAPWQVAVAQTVLEQLLRCL